MSSPALRASGLALLAATALAQEVQVLGPRSPIETYEAPVLPPAKTSGFIDFPKLISEPGANDSVQITPSLLALRLEFVASATASSSATATPAEGALNDFISTTGSTRVPAKDRARLHAALVSVLAKYRDLPLTLGDTRFLQQDITEAYRSAGYPLLSVIVPPQEIVDGRLRVQINEFALSAYQIAYGDGQGAYSPEASHRSSDRRLAALLDPLLREPVLAQASLDKKVKWLNAGPYRQARVIFEPGKQLGETTAQLQIDEQRPWSVQAGYNNHATKSSGTDRYSLGGAMGYLPFENHQLSWNASVGNRIEEFENYSLIYTAPLSWGHKFTANANYSDTASSTNPAIPGSASTTLQLSAAYEIPIIQGDKFTWDLGLTAFLKQFERESLFGGLVVGSASFDATTLVVDNRFGWKEATATNQFTVAATLNFEGLTGRNTDADFIAFNNRATGDATTQHLVLNYARVQQLAPLLGQSLDGWSTETQLSWQLTRDDLAGADNFAIGGPQVLRAYESSAVAGDEGVYFIQFLHARPFGSDALGFAGKWIEQVAPSAFFEAGEGSFRAGGSESLWDYGLQVAASAKPCLSVTASLAFAGKELADTARGNPRFFLSAQWRY